MKKSLAPLAAVALFAAASTAYAANVVGFSQTVLQTSATDPQLVNPWGISESATSPFWVSNNGTGTSTLYNSAGVKQALVVTMPAGSQGLTGQVFNGTAGNFNGDTFVFATVNGTITGWRGALGTNAETLFTVSGAAYTGLAISTDKSTLYGADFAKGTIDVFKSSGLQASIADATVPAGFAPFNIQNVNGKLYVTYAKVGPGGRDVAGAGNGFVSVFDPVGGTFTRVVSQGALNSPWGIAIAPNSFGVVGGDLLVGNFGDGLINAYDPISGGLVGTLAAFGGTPIENDGLWALQFGNGGNGGLATSLYITAGPNNETGGLFARIDAVPEPSALLLGAVGLAFVLLRRAKAPVSRQNL